MNVKYYIGDYFDDLVLLEPVLTWRVKLQFVKIFLDSILINPGQKVGVVGRTGAGKTSFVLSLFRFLETVEGKILVDGEDISERNLCCHRTSITIIPQVRISPLPVYLFAKTVCSQKILLASECFKQHGDIASCKLYGKVFHLEKILQTFFRLSPLSESRVPNCEKVQIPNLVPHEYKGDVIFRVSKC